MEPSNFPAAAAALYRSLARNDLPAPAVTPDMERQFALYCDLLQEWNTRFNLTAVKERGEIYVRHFLDSIAAAPFLPPGAGLCDIGSGAGFPGIPLKIVRPDLEVTLLDSLRKRVGFLQEVLAALFPAGGIRAEHLRAEEAAAPGRYREAFALTTARAVAPLPTLLEYALPLTKPGGCFFSYKSSAYAEELAGAGKALRVLRGACPAASAKLYTLPPDVTRALLLVEKTAPTPAAYPRGGNRPRTQPL